MSYNLWYTSATGERLRTLNDCHGFTAQRIANDVGYLTMTLPLDFPLSWLRLDRMVQVWRSPRRGNMALWNVYLLRYWDAYTDAGEEFIQIEAECPNGLLRRRIPPYFAQQAETSKTDYADDMMKEIVDENFINDSSTPTYGSRDYGSFTAQYDLSDGPSLTKEFSWRPVLRALRDIAEASAAAGTELFFEVVPVVSQNSIAFQFQTNINQPGIDRTGQGAIFSRTRGTISNVHYIIDAREEENYIYAAGQGVEDERNVQEVYDTTAIAASPWNRCEGFADARNEEPDNGVREAGRQRLHRGRARTIFRADIVNTERVQFQRDWDFGDKVRAVYRGMEFDCVVRAVTIGVGQDGRETIDARLEYVG